MAKLKKMDVGALSNDEIQELFDAAYQEQVASYNNIQNFESKCTKSVGGLSVTIEVEISGLAGSPTADNYKKGKVINAGTVKIARADKGEATFKLVADQTINLNSVDYLVVYKAV